MTTKSQQLQIRVTPGEKATLKRLAKQVGEDVSISTYVLARALPQQQLRFAQLVTGLQNSKNRRFALAELNDFLTRLAPSEYPDAVDKCDRHGLSSFSQNYLAAMVERAAEMKKLNPPSWVHDVMPLDEPWFATRLKNLRLHLIRAAPVAFKRRNLFVDSSLGDRV